MIDYIILGAIQGIVDWLPISSEGVLVLAQIFLFEEQLSLSEMIRVALFLHLGSFFAVIIYFWKDFLKLFKAFLNYSKTSKEEKSFLNFLIISSFFTGSLGFFIYKAIENSDGSLVHLTGPIIMLLIGFLLLITSFLQFFAKKVPESNLKTKETLSIKDAVITGIVQGLAVLPGLSRSGSTISTLLLLKIKDTDALKISFFMGLPVILGGNLILNIDIMTGGLKELVGLITAFIFGILTIHILMKIAEKISFAWFTLFFGLLTIFAGVIAFWF